MQKINLGVGITGSFCTFKKTLTLLSELSKTYELHPIISYSVRDFSTRFFEKQDFISKVEEITSRKVIDSIVDAEPIGPKSTLDALVIVPATGNTIAKIANGITDTPVTLAAKAHLRNLRPLIICPSTNDGLSSSLKNLATLYNKKYVYISPFAQDDHVTKPNSLVADFSKIPSAITSALSGVQIQPLLV